MQFPFADFDLMFLPGYGNSTGAHWQAEWYARLPGSSWAQMPTWLEPEADVWLHALDQQAAACEKPLVVVTHSLGGLLMAQWAPNARVPLAACMMVAPPDPGSAVFPPVIQGFADPTRRLPCPGLLVASTDDPYATMEWSRRSAATLGLELATVGACGHINRDSGNGPWPAGELLFQGLVSSLTFPCQPRRN